MAAHATKIGSCCLHPFPLASAALGFRFGRAEPLLNSAGRASLGTPCHFPAFLFKATPAIPRLCLCCVAFSAASHGRQFRRPSRFWAVWVFGFQQSFASHRFRSDFQPRLWIVPRRCRHSLLPRSWLQSPCWTWTVQPRHRASPPIMEPPHCRP